MMHKSGMKKRVMLVCGLVQEGRSEDVLNQGVLYCNMI